MDVKLTRYDTLKCRFSSFCRHTTLPLIYCKKGLYPAIPKCIIHYVPRCIWNFKTIDMCTFIVIFYTFLNVTRKHCRYLCMCILNLDRRISSQRFQNCINCTVYTYTYNIVATCKVLGRPVYLVVKHFSTLHIFTFWCIKFYVNGSEILARNFYVSHINTKHFQFILWCEMFSIYFQRFYANNTMFITVLFAFTIRMPTRVYWQAIASNIYEVFRAIFAKNCLKIRYQNIKIFQLLENITCISILA